MEDSNLSSFEDFYQTSERRMRISIDIDSKKEEHLKPIKTFFNLKNIFPNCEVKMDKTRHGFHVKAVGKEIEKIPVEKRIIIRERCGDDHLRIDYDKLKLRLGLDRLCDTLFSMKRGFDGKISIVESINPVALPWISQIPAKKHHSFSKVFRTAGRGIP